VIPPADFRAWFHAATGLVALGLGVFPYALSVAGAVLGVVAGWIVIPRTPLEARLRRPGEPWLNGLRTYPVAVILLVLFLRPATLAATAWAVWAAGDAAASLVGRHVRAPALFGHRKATWSGTPAFVVLGTLAGYGAGRFVEATGRRGDLAARRRALAAVASALVDLVRIPPDDNLPNALAAGVALVPGAHLSG
jgi:dolichol kinase